MLLLTEGLFILKNKRINNRRLIFVVFATTQWILLSGLRHITIGEDTHNYSIIFDRTIGVSILDLFGDIKMLFVGDIIGVEPGYYLFQKLVQLVFPDYRFFLFVVAILFSASLGVWIYRYSKDPLVSFLIYSTLFYHFFAFTGFRQTIATAVVVMIGYKYIQQRKMKQFIILTLIAFTIHKSAILFLPFYFIANSHVTRKHILFTLVLFPILMVFRVPIALKIIQLSGYHQYELFEGAGTYNFTLMLLLVTIVSMWKMKYIISNNPSAKHFFNAIIIALLLTPLTWVNPSAMRAVQYYSLFLMLLIPEIFGAFNKKEKVLVYYIGIGVLLLLFIRNSPHYIFYWK